MFFMLRVLRDSVLKFFDFQPFNLQVSVHTPVGDWSIFRRENIFFGQTEGRKHGPVPFPRREGDSPIFAAIKHFYGTIIFCAAKIGTVPCERLPLPEGEGTINSKFAKLQS